MYYIETDNLAFKVKDLDKREDNNSRERRYLVKFSEKENFDMLNFKLAPMVRIAGRL